MFGAHVVVWGATVLSVCLCTKQVFLLLVSGIDTVKVPLNSTACFCLKVTQILVGLRHLGAGWARRRKTQ